MSRIARLRAHETLDAASRRAALAYAAAVLACTLCAVPAFAQPAESPAPAAQERPARGMKMSQVEARFGAPASRSEAVGRPPITRWDYPGMIVYFEHDHVVHAVLRGT